MKKFYFLLLLPFFVFFAQAQVTIQGFPRNNLQGKFHQENQGKTTDFTFDDVQFWVGTGSNRAVMVVQWNDSKNPDALVWGFRWDGEAKAEDMIKAIAKADKRFYSLMYYSGPGLGTALGGLGFDNDGKGIKGLYKNHDSANPFYPENGVINTSTYDFDSFSAIDTNDRWQAGWKTEGYWSYWVRSSAQAKFSYSGLGISSRKLKDGSWDLWNFNVKFKQAPTATTFTAVSTPPLEYTQGYFMINEDWFGHRNGSLNFITNTDEVIYRPYATVNNNGAFGATAQFGTIYGGNLYVVSKQESDGGDSESTAGGRLVVADAVTLVKKAGFDNIGDGDGRSFLGVDEHTGYIGASNGIYLFDIDHLSVGNIIPGTGGGELYDGQIGNMIRTSQYVFAIKQDLGIFVINPKTHTIIKTIEGAFNSIVQAKDGSVWAIQSTKLVNINTIDFSTTSYDLPSGKDYDGSWGAWNAGTLTGSISENALYYFPIIGWSADSTLVKFDVDSKTFNTDYFKIQPLDPDEFVYGAGVRINPVTNDFIITTTNSYTSDQIYRHNKEGVLQSSIKLNENYFYQAMPVFPDNAAPVVSSTFPAQVTLSETKTIDLKNLVSDFDNLSSAIVKSVKSNSNETAVSAEVNANDVLVLTPQDAGTASIILSFNSNGKVVEKTLTVISSSLATSDIDKIHLRIFPNPTSDILNIKTNDKILNISVYDISGKQITLRGSNEILDVRSLPKGIYFLKITTDKAVYQEKFIKQ